MPGSLFPMMFTRWILPVSIRARLRRFSPWMPLVILAIWGALSIVPAHAARVILKSGAVLDGAILDEVPEKYVLLRTSNAEFRLNWSRIASIDRMATERIEETAGDQLRAQGRLAEALARYENALATGRASAEVSKKIEAVKKQIEDKELTQHSQQLEEAQLALSMGQLARTAQLLESLVTEDQASAVRHKARQMMAQVHFRRAQRASDRVDYRTAEAELSHAIEYDPSFGPAHVQLGYLFANRTDTRLRALEEFAQGLALGEDILSSKERQDIRWEMARISSELGQKEKALEYYKAIYAENPRYSLALLDNIISHYLMLAAQRAAQDRVGATDLLQQALQMQSNNVSVRFYLAGLYAESQQYADALEQLQAILVLDDRLPNVNYLTAFCLLQQGKVLEARSHLLAETRISPDHYNALCDLGDLSIRGGDLDAAEQHYSGATNVDAGRTRAQMGLAKVKRRKGDRVVARNLVDQVLKGDPKNRMANLEMGNIMKEEKDYKGSRKFFDQVIESLKADEAQKSLSSEDQRLAADALNSRGEVFILLEQPRTARKDFEDALNYYPAYGLSYFNIGQSYLKEGANEENLKKAEQNMSKARQLEPSSPEFAQGLGILFHQYWSQMNIPDERKRECLAKAVENYRDYLALGGADQDNVKKWIEECGGKALGE